jgi:DNA processing protein
VSELAPDVVPTQGTFPRRNRIISGLSQATVVVEAPARSGALITASWALEQGRDCFLVPGAIDSPASSGCLSFLREFRDEARLVAGIPQLIADLGLSQERVTPSSDAVAAATLDDIGETEATVARQLLAGRVTVDEIVASTGHPVATILTALAMLERRGLAVGVHGRYRASGSLLGAPPRPRPR